MSNGQELARCHRRVVKVHVVVEPVRPALSVVYVSTPTKVMHFTLHDGCRLVVRTIILYEAKVYSGVLVDGGNMVFVALIVGVS